MKLLLLGLVGVSLTQDPPENVDDRIEEESNIDDISAQDELPLIKEQIPNLIRAMMTYH